MLVEKSIRLADGTEIELLSRRRSLSLDPVHVRLERLNTGAPFLKVHEIDTLDAVSGEIGVRVVKEVSGAVVEVMLDTDIPAATQLLSPRNYMNNGATAAAFAPDCSGVYVETDY